LTLLLFSNARGERRTWAGLTSAWQTVPGEHGAPDYTMKLELRKTDLDTEGVVALPAKPVTRRPGAKRVVGNPD